ncbi:hypothetical protein Esti_001348 [Eimeria stiedai]
MACDRPEHGSCSTAAPSPSPPDSFTPKSKREAIPACLSPVDPRVSFKLSKMATEKEDAPRIDTDLYSRQIGAFGMEAMGKLMQLRVLITGLNGQGVECAKNIILAGPRAVGLHDPRPARGRDLGSVFCFGDAAIEKGLTRAAASVSYLSNLNQYVLVTLRNYDALVVCEGSASSLIRLNTLCRAQSPPVGFVCGLCAGLCLAIFSDFGPSFRVLDSNGEECKEAIIAGVTKEENGVVVLHADKPLPFQDGDFISFREVGGMTELNDAPPQKIQVLGKQSFKIGDTRSFGTYTMGGIARQVKVHADVHFRSFEESLLRPIPEGEASMVVADLAKLAQPEQLHFAFAALLKLLDERQGEPVPHPVLYSATAAAQDPAAAAAAKAAGDTCVARAKAIAEGLLQQSRAQAAASVSGVVAVDSLDGEILDHVVRCSACCLSPIASFVGGVVAQEVVKLTGKYTPLRGFLYLDALECLLSPQQQQHLQQQQQQEGLLLQQQLQQENLSSLLDWRYADQVGVFGEALQLSLFSSRVFIVGAGALGCELLKAVALMGVSCLGGAGKVTITDMDRIEVSNLNRQFLFRKEHVGMSKSTTAAAAASAMNPRLKIEALEARVGLETEGTVFNESFWRSQDIIINALDNIQIRQLLSAFPLDHRTESGALFWASPKRPPKAIEFDAKDALHMQFVLAAANLFANGYGVPEVRDMQQVQQLAAAVKPSPFVEKQLQLKIDEEEEGSSSSSSSSSSSRLEADVQQSEEEERQRLQELLEKLSNLTEAEGLVFTPLEFEKDDDANHHVDFVHAAAMLRAANYSIEPCDRQKTKIIAGRIIPAIATTTAMTTGLVGLEFFKVLTRSGRALADYKNAFVNLALPLWLLSEPMPPIRNVDKDFDPVAGGPVRAIPQGFTCWDRVEVDLPNCRVADLIAHLGERFDVNVDILSFGNYCLFNGFLPHHKQKRLNMPLTKLVEEVTKAPAPRVLLIETSCNSKKDGVDVLIPTVAIINSQYTERQ